MGRKTWQIPLDGATGIGNSISAEVESNEGLYLNDIDKLIRPSNLPHFQINKVTVLAQRTQHFFASHGRLDARDEARGLPRKATTLTKKSATFFAAHALKEKSRSVARDVTNCRGWVWFRGSSRRESIGGAAPHLAPPSYLRPVITGLGWFTPPGGVGVRIEEWRAIEIRAAMLAEDGDIPPSDTPPDNF